MGDTLSLLINTPKYEREMGNKFTVECNYCDSFNGFSFDGRKEGKFPLLCRFVVEFNEDDFLKLKCLLLVCLKPNCVKRNRKRKRKYLILEANTPHNHPSFSSCTAFPVKLPENSTCKNHSIQTGMSPLVSISVVEMLLLLDCSDGNDCSTNRR